MKNLKIIIGLVLVAVSVAAFVFWELTGRDLVFEKNMVVAASSVNEGDVLSEENLTVKGINNECIVAGAFGSGSIEELKGKKVKQFIPEGAQICGDYLTESDTLIIGKEQSIYCIPEEDLDMVSSSLRRGDRVHIYGNSGREDLGVYAVAFVKDKSDREVKNAESLKNNSPVDRENSNYSISSLEIISTREQYMTICNFLKLSEEGLTVVQVPD